LSQKRLEAFDEEVVTEIFALAAGLVSEKKLADWIRQRCGKLK
jgi:hypothetical protein